MSERTDSMPKIQHMLHAEIDLSKPVPELCELLAHILNAWPGNEKEILTNLRDVIDKHIQYIEKGVDKNGK